MTSHRATALRRLARALRAQRTDLLHRHVAMEGDLQQAVEALPSEVEERSEDDRIADLLVRLDERTSAQIVAIDAALARLADGSYGTCRTCGMPIPLRRLRAVPTTAHCASCAALAEGATAA